MKLSDLAPRVPRLSPVTPTDKAIEAMNVALYWARTEALANACETCDPVGEGAEIWSEIGAGLVEGIRALGGVPDEMAGWQRDELTRQQDEASR